MLQAAEGSLRPGLGKKVALCICVVVGSFCVSAQNEMTHGCHYGRPQCICFAPQVGNQQADVGSYVLREPAK